MSHTLELEDRINYLQDKATALHHENMQLEADIRKLRAENDALRQSVLGALQSSSNLEASRERRTKDVWKRPVLVKDLLTIYGG